MFIDSSKLGKEVASAVERNRDDMVGQRAYSLATPALALCSSERAYFITWERSEWPISAASSLTCPGLACKNHVPKVRLRSWGFTSWFLMQLFLAHDYRL